MAKYEAIGKLWLTLDQARGPRLIREGEKFEYDGWPNAMMQPLDEAGEQNVATLKVARPRYGDKLPETPEKARAVMKVDKAGPVSAGDDKPGLGRK